MADLFDMTNNNLSFDKKKIQAFFNFWRPQIAYKKKKKSRKMSTLSV